MQSRLPSDAHEKATMDQLIDPNVDAILTHKRAVSDLVTKGRVEQKAVLRAGRLWNKSIFSKRAKVCGCGLTLEAEEGILWPQRGFIYSLLWTETQELFQLHTNI